MAIDLTELLATGESDVSASLADIAANGASGVLAAMAAMPLLDTKVSFMGEGLTGVNSILSLMDSLKDSLPLPGPGGEVADLLAGIGQSSIANFAAGLATESLQPLEGGAESSGASLLGLSGVGTLSGLIGAQTSLAEYASAGILGAAGSFLNPQVSGILDSIRPMMAEDPFGFAEAFKGVGSGSLALSAMSQLDPELVSAWSELGLRPSTVGLLRELDFELPVSQTIEDVETVPASPEVERYERLVETQAETVATLADTVATLARVSDQLTETRALVAVLTTGDQRQVFDRRLAIAAFVVGTAIGILGLAVGVVF